MLMIRQKGKNNPDIAKLRADKLIIKIPHSFRYEVTSKGVRIMSEALVVKNIKFADSLNKDVLNKLY
jgi:hypothetical protein